MFPVIQKSNDNECSSTVNFEPDLSAIAILENYQWIAESAYYKALARNFMPNRDQEDWLEAKKDYEAIMSKQQKKWLGLFAAE